MNDVLSVYLFNRGCFVSCHPAPEHAPEAALMLGFFFGIRLTSHPELADLEMVRLAQERIGTAVPEPFYKGFPASVRKLTTGQLLADQILHYIRTYGFGDFSEPGHSIFEDEVERAPLLEDVTERPFAILTPDEARAWVLKESASLLARTRPLSDEQLDFVATAHVLMGLADLDCMSKDTAARLVLATRDVGLSRWLKLSDVIRLVEWLARVSYDGDRIKKLNLRNQDRRFVTSVLDHVFEHGHVDKDSCLERRQDWKGLLHHLHYRPKTEEATAFCACVRKGRERSVYSGFERLLAEGDAVGAARLLRRAKGEGALVRRLNHILSRTDSDEEFDAVLDLLEGASRVALIQLMVMYHLFVEGEPRTFTFVRFSMLRVHSETPEEGERRHTMLAESQRRRAEERVREVLARSLAGSLGTVYVDEEMRLAVPPFAEGAAMKGTGTRPAGSRRRIEAGKTVRAFVWWKLVNDIDLSCFGVGAGKQWEFSWRTMSSCQEGLDALVFSGDQTSGYDGGSEYFDVDLPAFRATFPDVTYLVFCANVFSNENFSDCTCRSGFMLRAHPESGEIFEPSTVSTALDIDCKSKFCYLFAIDLTCDQIVWLNLTRGLDERVAGRTSMSPLLRYLEAAKAVSLWDLARMSATELADTPAEADIVFTDSALALADGQEQVRSSDTARISEIFGL